MKKLNLLKLGFFIALLFGVSAMFAQTPDPNHQPFTTFSDPYPDPAAQTCGTYLIDILATGYGDNNNDVGALSFTIQYPNTMITTPEVIWNEDDFNGYDDGEPANNQIRIAWDDNAGQNTSNGFPPQTKIFTLKFSLLTPYYDMPLCLTWPENGAGGNQAYVNEVAGPGGYPKYVDGFVDKCWDTNSELEIISVTPTCSQCPDGPVGPTGTITVVVAGGSETYYYHWSGGDFWEGPDPIPAGKLDPNVQNPTGLIAGDYHLTVTDSDYCSVETDVTVDECPILPPALVDPVHKTVSCLGDTDIPENVKEYIDYEWVYPYPPTYVDFCGNDLDPDGPPQIIDTPDPLDCEGSREYRYAYTDYYGNTVYWSFFWHIEKSSLAYLLGPNVVVDVDCAGLACCSVAPVVDDDCGVPLTWDSRSDNCSIIPDCNETQVVHEYYYSDCTGATYTWTYTYNIDMPDFDLPELGESGVDCLSELSQDDPTYFNPAIFLEGVEFKDACNNDMTPTNLTISSFPVCEGDVVYSWLLTDCVGHTQTWTHTVTNDYLPITNYPDEELDVTCPIDAETQPSTTHLVDACGAPLTIVSFSHSEFVGLEGGDVVWTFKLEDCTGAYIYWYFTYHVELENFTPPDNYTINYTCPPGDVKPDPAPWLANCSELITPVLSEIDGEWPILCEGTTIFEFSYESAYGWNHDQYITVTVDIADFVLPADVLPPYSGNNYTFTGTTVVCPGDLEQAVADLQLPAPVEPCTLAITVDGPVQLDATPDCGDGSYVSFKWTYSNCAQTEEWIYTFKVVDDVPPTLVAPNDISFFMNEGCMLTGIKIGDLGDPLEAYDNCGGLITVGAALAESYNAGPNTVIWSAIDCAGNVSTDTQILTVKYNKITGVLEYNNFDYPPNEIMNGVKVQLYDNANNFITQKTTNGVGYYAFNGLCAGIYEIRVDENELLLDKKGESNGTDAGRVQLFANQYHEIEKVQYMAGDVFEDYKDLDVFDAVKILHHYVNGETPAFNDDPYYWNFFFKGVTTASDALASWPNKMKVNIGGSNVGNILTDLLGQLEGDFNGTYSFFAGKSASESLSLEYGPYQLVERGAAIELPMIAEMDMEVGAISLVMNFPADEAKITGVYLANDPSAQVMYNVSGNELRIGWTSMDAIWVNKGESLVTLQMKLNDETSEGIQFNLTSSLNELADADFLVFDATLVIDIPSTSALGTGVNLATENLEFTTYPNPFKGTTTLNYTLPVDGQVIIEVYNLVGSKVIVAVDETQSAGNYTLRLDANNLQPGIYTAILILKNSDNTVTTRAIKMINR